LCSTNDQCKFFVFDGSRPVAEDRCEQYGELEIDCDFIRGAYGSSYDTCYPPKY
jgi:hypothetical protein